MWSARRHASLPPNRRGPPWPTVWESGHDLARKAPQLLLAAEQRQDDVFGPGAL